MSQAGRFFLAVIVACAAIALAILHAKADDERAAFFRDAKKAIRICDPPKQTKDCCGLGDGVKVRVQYGDNIIATVTGTGRHPTAKVGQQVVIPKCAIAKWPVVPASMRTDFLFIGSTGVVHCFFPQAGG